MMERMQHIYFNEYERNGSAREIEITCGSDYSGGVIERVNFEIMSTEINDQFPDTEAFVELEGLYGSYGIGVFEDKLTDEEMEWLEEKETALADYPVLNDEKVYETEEAILSEFFHDDVLFELERYFDDYIEQKDVVITEIDRENTDWLWDKAMSEGHAIVETGMIPYIDWDKLFKSCDQDKLYSLLIEEKVQ